MTGWTVHKGAALAFDRENVDTDQLIPARFMVTPRAEGYGRFLFHDLRHDAAGAPLPDFALNRHPGVSILVCGRNFGSGSSREAAVYALVDAGIRVVVAPSFGDIFAANAVNNGLLPARIDDTGPLIGAMGSEPVPARVDLAAGTLGLAGSDFAFAIGPAEREKLMNGWDDIDLTRAHEDRIAAFREARLAAAPWAFPPQDGA